MSKLSLRPATIKEITAMEKLLSDASLPTNDITKKIDELYVGEIANMIVAVGGIETAGRYGLIRSVIIVPEQRGSGLGKEICNRLIDMARSKKLEGLYLLTMTADKFFESLGFQVTLRASVPDSISKTKEFSEICPDSAVCMYLSLDVKEQT